MTRCRQNKKKYFFLNFLYFFKKSRYDQIKKIVILSTYFKIWYKLTLLFSSHNIFNLVTQRPFQASIHDIIIPFLFLYVSVQFPPFIFTTARCYSWRPSACSSFMTHLTKVLPVLIIIIIIIVDCL